MAPRQQRLNDADRRAMEIQMNQDNPNDGRDGFLHGLWGGSAVPSSGLSTRRGGRKKRGVDEADLKGMAELVVNHLKEGHKLPEIKKQLKLEHPHATAKNIADAVKMGKASKKGGNIVKASTAVRRATALNRADGRALEEENERSNPLDGGMCFRKKRPTTAEKPLIKEQHPLDSGPKGYVVGPPKKSPLTVRRGQQTPHPLDAGPKIVLGQGMNGGMARGHDKEKFKELMRKGREKSKAEKATGAKPKGKQGHSKEAFLRLMKEGRERKKAMKGLPAPKADVSMIVEEVGDRAESAPAPLKAKKKGKDHMMDDKLWDVLSSLSATKLKSAISNLNRLSKSADADDFYTIRFSKGASKEEMLDACKGADPGKYEVETMMGMFGAKKVPNAKKAKKDSDEEDDDVDFYELVKDSNDEKKLRLCLKDAYKTLYPWVEKGDFDKMPLAELKTKLKKASNDSYGNTNAWDGWMERSEKRLLRAKKGSGATPSMGLSQVRGGKPPSFKLRRGGPPADPGGRDVMGQLPPPREMAPPGDFGREMAVARAVTECPKNTRGCLSRLFKRVTGQKGEGRDRKLKHPSKPDYGKRKRTEGERKTRAALQLVAMRNEADNTLSDTSSDEEYSDATDETLPRLRKVSKKGKGVGPSKAKKSKSKSKVAPAPADADLPELPESFEAESDTQKQRRFLQMSKDQLNKTKPSVADKILWYALHPDVECLLAERFRKRVVNLRESLGAQSVEQIPYGPGSPRLGKMNPIKAKQPLQYRTYYDNPKTGEKVYVSDWADTPLKPYWAADVAKDKYGQTLHQESRPHPDKMSVDVGEVEPPHRGVRYNPEGGPMTKHEKEVARLNALVGEGHGYERIVGGGSDEWTDAHLREPSHAFMMGSAMKHHLLEHEGGRFMREFGAGYYGKPAPPPPPPQKERTLGEKIKNEFVNPESKLRGEILPKAKAITANPFVEYGLNALGFVATEGTYPTLGTNIRQGATALADTSNVVGAVQRKDVMGALGAIGEAAGDYYNLRGTPAGRPGRQVINRGPVPRAQRALPPGRQPLAIMDAPRRGRRNAIVPQQNALLGNGKRKVKSEALVMEGGKRRRAKASPGDGRRKRATIVAEVMKKRGVSMIEASKIVKKEGLY